MERTTRTESQMDIQIGGSHYKKYVVQPIEFAAMARMTFVQGSVVKYLVRHRDKNGAEDLDKAMHICAMAIDMGQRTHKPDDGQRAAVEVFARVNSLDVLTEDAIRLTLEEEWERVVELIERIKRRDYGE